jgi:phenylacetate-CoA ligase
MLPHHAIHLYGLIRNQWKNPETIKKIQERKLRKLIHYVYENVPYYRNLFDSLKIKPFDIRKKEDLQFLPLTSKRQLQGLPLKDITSNALRLEICKTFYTSGTTGIPMQLYYDPHDVTLMNLSWVRAFLAGGMKPWHKLADFKGMKTLHRKKAWYEYLGLLRRREISAWDAEEKWIEEIRKWKPQVLIGYVRTLRMLAEAVQRSGIKEFKPKIIFHSSAILDEATRRLFSEVFQGKRVDIYGSYEGGCLAWECEICSGYHLCSDMVIVEVLNQGKPVAPGETGEVVITNLQSYAMPFIRYKQEDQVTLSGQEPRCGRGLELLDSIHGRTDDFITLQNGQRISPQPFLYLMEKISGIRQWRAIQEKMNELNVEIEPSELSHESLTLIKESLKGLLGSEMNIHFILVDSIKVDPPSKFRFVSSKINRS